MPQKNWRSSNNNTSKTFIIPLFRPNRMWNKKSKSMHVFAWKFMVFFLQIWLCVNCFHILRGCNYIFAAIFVGHFTVFTLMFGLLQLFDRIFIQFFFFHFCFNNIKRFRNKAQSDFGKNFTIEKRSKKLENSQNKWV